MSLNVVGLISGGKDSLYSLVHCIEHGNKVVALANLYPKSFISEGEDVRKEANVEGEDLNSFMYQTVGHTIIPLYSQALGLPLFRRQISGSAIQTGRYYDPGSVGQHFDETEDLTILLKEVLIDHPEVNAVSSGAILSTYQRTRVESVAVRLGLTPLSYLWQYPALPPPIGRGDSLTGLLDDMEAAGCDARIIKIASGGIKESLLWSNVTNPSTKGQIISGLSPFFDDQEFSLRGAILGEGGEYETLAVSGPPYFWKTKIIVDDAGCLTGEGGTSYVLFSGARIDDQTMKETKCGESLRIPFLLDRRFAATQESIQRLKPKTKIHSDRVSNHFSNTTIDVPPASCHLTSTHLVISNLTSFDSLSTTASSDPAVQLKAVVDQLPSLLLDISPDLTTSSIISSTLLLRSISDFAAINPIYSQIWPTGLPNPPARVTIAAPLPPRVQVALSLILSFEPTSQRKGLHVQSRSYWAPANIGPYSQAINFPLLPPTEKEKNVNLHDANLLEAIHMAGQIPLLPASMELLEPHVSFNEHAVLSLQHLWRVGQERGVDLWTWGVAYLAKSEEGDSIDNAILAMNVWKSVHEVSSHECKEGEEEEDIDDQIDIWDLQNNLHRGGGRFTFSQGSQTGAVGNHLHILPNNTVFQEMCKGEFAYAPPFVAAEVTALPRNARIEWWSMGLAGLASGKDSRTGNTEKATVRSLGVLELSWGKISGFTLKLHTEFESIKLEDAQENGIDNEGMRSDQEKETTTVTFATVLISVDAMDPTRTFSVPQTPKELIEIINSSRTTSLEGFPLAHHEVVHATAFLNYSNIVSRAQSPPQHLTNPLFAKAVAIPCHHLWAASAADLIGSKEHRQAWFEEKDITEFGAVLLLRIDSKPA